MCVAVNNLDLIKTNLSYFSPCQVKVIYMHLVKLHQKGLNKMRQILALVSLEPYVYVPI